jgi:hypothetical protein
MKSGQYHYTENEAPIKKREWKLHEEYLKVTRKNFKSLFNHCRIRGDRFGFEMDLGDSILINVKTLVRDYRSERYLKKVGWLS